MQQLYTPGKNLWCRNMGTDKGNSYETTNIPESSPKKIIGNCSDKESNGWIREELGRTCGVTNGELK